MAINWYDPTTIPRMKDYLKPDQLNLDGCIELTGRIMSDAAEALTIAVKRYANCPSDSNAAHLKNCRDFYTSEYFAALSCGIVDGQTAMRDIQREALRNFKINNIGGNLEDGEPDYPERLSRSRKCKTRAAACAFDAEDEQPDLLQPGRQRHSRRYHQHVRLPSRGFR